MKYALISPNEVSGLGYRVCETSDTQFPVALPLFWIECDDNTKAEEYFYSPETNGLVINKPQALLKISFGDSYTYNRLDIKTDVLPATVTFENKSLNRPTYSRITIENEIYENQTSVVYSFNQHGTYPITIEAANESGTDIKTIIATIENETIFEVSKISI